MPREALHRLRTPALIVCAASLGCASGPRLDLQPAAIQDAACVPAARLEGLRKIAVLDFSDSTERRTEKFSPPAAARALGATERDVYRYLPGDGRLAAESVENALRSAARFSLIERRGLEALLREQRLQATGLIDPRQAVEIGKLAGADAVLMGRVDQAYAGYEARLEPGAWVGTYLGHAGLSMRLVHVESGQVAWTCQLARNALHYLDSTVTLTAPAVLRSPHRFDQKLGGATPEERIRSILQAAARDAVERLTGL